MGLAARFSKERGTTTVRVEIDPVVGDGGVLVLFGPSGCGKTTALRCLAGLDQPEEGFIEFDEERWFDSQRRICLSPQHRGVGLVAQEYALFPHLSVAENIEFGLSALPWEERRRRCAELVGLLQIDGLETRRPASLSGGQQQRVALARALAHRPRLLLLDEPLSALDAATRGVVRRELRALLTTLRIPAIVVTHDRVEAVALGDAVALMEAGRILQCGPTTEVFSRPASLEAARVVGVETVERGRIIGQAAGLATVRVRDAELHGLLPPGEGTDVFVFLRAEDVTLEKGPSGLSSGRNRLQGRVREIFDEGTLVRVVVDAGFLVTSLITRQSREALAIAVNDELVCAFKATAVHLVRA